MLRPSNLCAQAMYQMLEPGFIGLIFSVFNRDAATKGHSVSATAFQSLPAGSPGAAAAGGGGGSFSAGGGEALGGGGSFTAELAGMDSATRDAIRAATAGALFTQI